MQNEQVVFRVNKTELKKVYKDITKLIPQKDVKSSHILEFEFNSDGVEINSIGMIFSMNCEIDYKGKVLIPYQIFKMIALYAINEEVTITLTNNRISFENKSYTSEDIAILGNEEDNNKDGIILSLNYSRLELISLKHKFNDEYLEKRNLLYKVEAEEQRLDSVLLRACELLSEYEIKPKDLRELVMKKMERYLD